MGGPPPPGARERAPGAAIVTGGSSGIGRALAERLAAAGHDVAILARDPERLAAAADAIAARRRDRRQRVLPLSADVAVRGEATAAIEEAVAALGPPALLVASAGIAAPGRFREVPDDLFERAMAINYFGSLWCVRAALPAMTAAGAGRIVLVSSGAALVGVFGYAPYAPSKFAVRGLAEALRGELRPVGIGVSIVYPPDTDTPQLAAERATRPAETDRIVGLAPALSADAVAAAILEGVARGRFAICPGWRMAALYRLQGLVGPVLQRGFDRIVDRHARDGDA